MTKQEISTILTESGIGGLEKEIKKVEKQNLNCYLIVILCIVFINLWLLNDYEKSKRKEIQQFKFDYATKVGKQYGIAMDSLVKIADSKGIENCTK